MKVMPTLQGGLRIDAENSGDWQILNGITQDAISCDETLADRLGRLVTDEDVAQDWQDFVVPDLDESFHADLARVASAISSAYVDAGDGPGAVWITRDNAFFWYSALNQARLALEERHHFGPSEVIDPVTMEPELRSAFLRSQFYCAIQSLLLEHVMR